MKEFELHVQWGLLALLLSWMTLQQWDLTEAKLYRKMPNRIPTNRSFNPQLRNTESLFVEDKIGLEHRVAHINLNLFQTKMNNVYFYEKCSPTFVEKVSDANMYILYSRPQPNEYDCVQKFRAGNSSSILHLLCYSVDMRFSCKFESLKVRVNDVLYYICSGLDLMKLTVLTAWFKTSVNSSPHVLDTNTSLCRKHGSVTPLQYVGRSMELTYGRHLFGLHGGYTCALVSKNYETPLGSISSCGVSANNARRSPISPKIVSGVDAEKSEFPWMVRLEIRVNNVSFICGGSLISTSVVLTAAHCLFEGATEVLIGLGKISLRDDAEEGSITMKSRNFTIHPQFDRFQFLNDIAIIFLPSPVTFTENVRPVCLPAPGSTDTLVGYTATAIGWGSTKYEGPLAEVLQRVHLTIWSREECNKAWMQFGVDIKEQEMCAYSEGKDSCSGDSGGPLLIKVEDQWILVGITSYGFECASPGVPGVYTRISEFGSWIKQYADT